MNFDFAWPLCFLLFAPLALAAWRMLRRGRRAGIPLRAGTPVMDDAMRPSHVPVTFSIRMLRRYVLPLPFGPWRLLWRMKMGVMYPSIVMLRIVTFSMRPPSTTSSARPAIPQ